MVKLKRIFKRFPYLVGIGIFLLILISIIVYRYIKFKKESYVNINNQRIVIFKFMNSENGFYSMFLVLCNAYIYAKKNGYPFFIENDNWKYTYSKGWHDYFITLKEYNNEYNDYEIERYTTEGGSVDKLPAYSIKETIEIIKEIYILQPHIINEIEIKKKEYGEYKSLYIRRGDKKNEITLMNTSDIIKATNLKNIDQTLFIQTDDYTAVEEVKSTLTNSKIVTITPTTHKGSNNNEMISWTPEQRKADTEQLLISVGIFLGGTECWSYFMSNISVFHKLSNYDKVHIYTDGTMTQETVEKKYDLNNIAHMYSLM
jgi:hypothetical protein